MKVKIILILAVFLLSALLISDSHARSEAAAAAAGEQKRVQFQVVTVQEKANERRILSQTTIEGAAGTDFNINLQTGNFKMKAQFLSDLINKDQLKIKAKLETRRFYGESPAQLPLYEEDLQNQSLQISFDQKIVLLPFGRNPEAETLKIEITPVLLTSASDSPENSPKIMFDRPLAGGEITVEAFKIPHHFVVEAVLLADNQEIALGKANCSLQEESEILFTPNNKAPDEIIRQPLIAKVTIDKFNLSRPNDLAGINFSVFQTNSQPENEDRRMIFSGAGVTSPGSELSYKLNDANLPKNKNYELRFKINLAGDESKR